MHRFGTILCMMLASYGAFAFTLESLEKAQYSPEKFGLTDLMVTVKAKSLAEILVKNQLAKAAKDISFRVYWDGQKRFAVKIEGTIADLDDVAKAIQFRMRDVFRYVIPESLVEKFANHKARIREKDHSIYLSDTSGKSDILAYTLRVDTSKKILSDVIARRPAGNIHVSILDRKSVGSFRQVVPVKLLTKISQAMQEMVIDTYVDYTEVQNFTFPEKVTYRVVVNQLQTKDGATAESVSSTEEFEFSDYVVNSGKAQAHFRKHPYISL